MKIYLAGPMSGIPKFNFPAFFAAARQLRSEGHEVFCPAENDIEKHGTGWWENSDGSHTNLPPAINYRNCLRDDLNWILDHADAIAHLPGWEFSSGVGVEHALGKALKLKMIYLPGGA